MRNCQLAMHYLNAIMPHSEKIRIKFCGKHIGISICTNWHRMEKYSRYGFIGSVTLRFFLAGSCCL